MPAHSLYSGFPAGSCEFFAIVTDPRLVQNPKSQQEAALEIEKYYQTGNLLKMFAGPDLIAITLGLLKRYEIRRQEVTELRPGYRAARFPEGEPDRGRKFRRAPGGRGVGLSR